MYLRPSEIYFSQAEINNHFDRNSDYPNNVGETLDMLVEGECSIDDIPTINVMKRNGKWVTADNRRLWVFRHLEKLGKCSTIPVEETYSINYRKLTSENGGRTVRFYSGRYAMGRWHQRVASIDPEYSPPPHYSTNQTSFSNRTEHRGGSITNSMNQPLNLNRFLDSMRSLHIRSTPSCPELDPSEIRYTKESIVVNYSDRIPRGNMEPITVYKVYGKYWVTDGNKRLWVCKNAHLHKIKATIKEDKDDFLDEVRTERPYLSLIDILQSGDNIQVL